MVEPTVFDALAGAGGAGVVEVVPALAERGQGEGEEALRREGGRPVVALGQRAGVRTV